MVPIPITASTATAITAARNSPNADSTATTKKEGKNADDEDAEAKDDNNNEEEEALEPMKPCYDPFPTAAILRLNGAGAEGMDALPEEFSLMAKSYFGEGEEAMERLVEEFKEALREEGITTPGNHQHSPMIHCGLKILTVVTGWDCIFLACLGGTQPICKWKIHQTCHRD